MASRKFLSWNVNGIRAILQKGFWDFFQKENPDILCLQEVKATRAQFDEAVKAVPLPGDYEIFWNAAEKPGYSGTAVFTQIKPKNVILGIGMKDHDTEGRVITLELDEFFLVNVYTPNAGEELKRLPYRLTWDAAFRKYLKTLEKKKPVIVCGDLNVAHTEIDLANPDSNHGNSGFTDEERAEFTKLLEAGFLDTYRFFDPSPKKYTWWTYRFGARSRNVGWRIDYFLTSKILQPILKNATIHAEIMGSDHCPVGLVLK